jgi:hypothetical protein
MNLEGSFVEIKLLIDKYRYNAFKSVNVELVTLTGISAPISVTG